MREIIDNIKISKRLRKAFVKGYEKGKEERWM
jgi:hypothetical protein